MSLNFSINDGEIEDLLRECDAIISQYQSFVAEPGASASNDLQELRNKIDNICENVTTEMNAEQIPGLPTQNSFIVEADNLGESNAEGSPNLPIQTDSTVGQVQKSTVSNVEGEDDIIFLGSTEPTSCPIIDLCTPTRNIKMARKRLANTSDIEIIEIQDITTFQNSNSKGRKNIKKTNDQNKSSSNNNETQPKVQCAICLECALNKTPTTTTCGHIFCHNCISLALKSNNRCPLCKKLKPKLVKLYGLIS